MRIDRLEFHNKDSGWHLEPIEFHPLLTLLVGFSGVGKTKVLRCLETLRDIARERPALSTGGVEWDLTVTTAEGQYEWTGELSKRDLSENSVNGSGRNGSTHSGSGSFRRFERESLTRQGATIVDRTAEEIRFNNMVLPKLPSDTSVVQLFEEEEAVRPLFDGFRHLVSSEGPGWASTVLVSTGFDAMPPHLTTLEALRESDLLTRDKLGILQEICPEVSHKIGERFKEAFPSVEEVRFRRIVENQSAWTALEIKERGSAVWIGEQDVASGMLQTLLHLASIELYPDGTVILIDEFENSLGVNCLDFVTESLMTNRRDLQFIITSHHPYIINNVPPLHWRILTRKGGVVTAHDAPELGIGRSRHEAFTQLINSEQYREGITVE